MMQTIHRISNQHCSKLYLVLFFFLCCAVFFLVVK